MGEYDTPKYRHVAKERPDISIMAAGWVEAVRDLWVQDADIDFASIEETWRLRALETSGDNSSTPEPGGGRLRLLCCLTGFDDADQRQQIIDQIVAGGGLYTGNLTRKVTHLIANRLEGQKYAAAKSWGIHVVSTEWLADSMQRGMILDEKCYDPALPPDERGKGAWTRREVKDGLLGKRLRDAAAAAQEEGRRKLRKTASMKFTSQKENIWGDILGKPQPTEPSASSGDLSQQPGASKTTQDATIGGPPSRSFTTQGSKSTPFNASGEAPIFSSCCFYVHGFPAKQAEILVNTITYMGGVACPSLDEVASNSGAQFAHRFLIVAQASKPATHPPLPDNVRIVTEFFVEKCLHKKRFFDPDEHVIGQPFPAFPIDGFGNLKICTAGFTGVDLNQVDKAIRQLGAGYEERFTAQISLLICTTLDSVRRQKLDLALAWKVPVVSADWLWTCISTGFKVPTKNYLFPELKQSLSREPGAEVEVDTQPRTDNPGGADQQASDQSSRKSASKSGIRDVDASAFSHEEGIPPVHDKKATEPRQKPPEEDSNLTADFRTAPTHPSQDSQPSKNPAPLAELSFNPRHGSRSPQKQQQPPRRQMSRIPSEIANSEATDYSADPDNDAADENDTPRPRRGSSTSAATRSAEDEKIAAERLALSAKLTNLLDMTTGGSDAFHGNNSTNNTHGAGSIAGPSVAASRPPRRKREILGRAISNVSAASSASVESSSNAGAAASLKAQSHGGSFSTAFANAGHPGGRGVGGVGRGGQDDDDDGEEGVSAPPLTQLNYEDPDAKKYKQQLMRKMLGEAPEADTAEGGDTGGGERLTLSELAGYQAAAMRSGPGLRTRRRRG